MDARRGDEPWTFVADLIRALVKIRVQIRKAEPIPVRRTEDDTSAGLAPQIRDAVSTSFFVSEGEGMWWWDQPPPEEATMLRITTSA